MTGLDGDGGGSRRDEGSGEASGDGLFDASQYAFFGKDVLEEVELGGFEDDDEGGFVGLEEEYQFSALGDREEGDALASLADIDDLTSTYSKIRQSHEVMDSPSHSVNRFVGDPRNTQVVGDRGSFSRESSSNADWARESDFSNGLNHLTLDAEHAIDGKRWWSQPHPAANRIADPQSLFRTSSSPQGQQQQYGSTEPVLHLSDSKLLYRTSSYPQEQPLEHSFGEPLPPNSSFTSYPSSGGPFQASPNDLRHNNPSSTPPFSASNFRPFSGSQLHLSGLPHGFHYPGNMSQFHPQGLSISSRQPNNWSNQADSFMGNQSNILPPILQQPPHSNGQMPPQLLPPLQQSVPHFPHFQPHLLNPYPSPRIMNNYEAVRGMADVRDQRMGSLRGREPLRFTQHASGIGNKRNENGWLQFRSKYMSAEEIENILRMQHAATHSNDPYVDDYYHQACLAKRSASSRLKHHFCPRDLSSRARANNEPHAFLQIDALGRVPFSSVRRPRPLLEVDPPSSSGDNFLDQKSYAKPLEQEPMLAARITIEDGICLLLDVDDIDRLAQFNQPQDGGPQLKLRRQMLLEELATSLQLADPLGPGNSDRSVGLDPNGDRVFLRLISLPKGQKLLSRYLERLHPSSELTRVVCMAVFRHLRFLFGSVPSDFGAAETTANLTRTICSRISAMDLSALSACLAAIVCSKDQPPLRPLGSPAGDGASVIIKSVLERATELLSNRDFASNCSSTNRALWQASFDAFFVLLTEYCLRKYESITQAQAPAAKAISKEMPVELLRASLPHTDEQQRKRLLDFAQRSMPASGSNSNGNGSEDIVSESVPS